MIDEKVFIQKNEIYEKLLYYLYRIPIFEEKPNYYFDYSKEIKLLKNKTKEEIIGIIIV